MLAIPFMINVDATIVVMIEKIAKLTLMSTSFLDCTTLIM